MHIDKTLLNVSNVETITAANDDDNDDASSAISETIINSNNDNDINDIENNYIKDILNWLDENPHINARKDRINLLYFLRGCKFDIGRTKKKIESFYLMRTERTEWYSNRNPFLPEIQELLKIGVFLPLKNKDKDGRLIVIIRTSAHDPKIHTQNNVIKTGKMILDLILHKDENISLTGVIGIFDMKNVQLGHALQMTPTIIKRTVESWKLYPCKLKLMEFINAPIHVNVILNTFRFFMTSKMKSRIIVRHTSSEIHCKNLLPKELGGKGESYSELAKYWKNFVEENADFYEDDDKYKMIL